MATKKKRSILIKCGKHLIAPQDIRCITQVRPKLYVIRFFSDPNPEYPCWVEEKDIQNVLEQFDIIEGE